jgi:hypothetical protein
LRIATALDRSVDFFFKDDRAACLWGGIGKPLGGNSVH